MCEHIYMCVCVCVCAVCVCVCVCVCVYIYSSAEMPHVTAMSAMSRQDTSLPASAELPNVSAYVYVFMMSEHT
jgi:hypothetical protein